MKKNYLLTEYGNKNTTSLFHIVYIFRKNMKIKSWTLLVWYSIYDGYPLRFSLNLDFRIVKGHDVSVVSHCKCGGILGVNFSRIASFLRFSSTNWNILFIFDVLFLFFESIRLFFDAPWTLPGIEELTFGLN